MSKFTMPVHWYMTAPVHTVRRDLSLNGLHHRFIKHRVSSFPVVDGDDSGQVIGVVSRTDLLWQSFSRRSGSPGAPLLAIPPRKVEDIMTPNPIIVDYEATVAEAATRMHTDAVHRVYVDRSGRLAGVLGARDVLPAIADLRLAEPISQYMSTPLFVVPIDEPIANATAFFETTHVSGVVVLGAAGPQGVFTQAEALECRDLPRDTPVGDAMDTDILNVAPTTPMHKVADEVVASPVRRVVVTDSRGARGIATPFDFVAAAR